MAARVIFGRLDGEKCIETFSNPAAAVKLSAELQEAGCNDSIVSAEGGFYVVHFTVSKEMLWHFRNFKIGYVKKP